MRKRRPKRLTVISGSKDLLPLAVLFLCFIISGVLGCLFVANSGEEGAASFTSYLTHYAAFFSSESVLSPSFFSVLLEFMAFPGLIFLLGFSSLGIFLIPAAFCVRAFLLSYTISVFFHVFGVVGSAASFSLFGLHILILIPVSFAIASYAYPASIRKAFGGGSVQAYFAGRMLPFVSCWIFILPGAVLQWAVMPSLLGTIFRQLI